MATGDYGNFGHRVATTTAAVRGASTLAAQSPEAAVTNYRNRIKGLEYIKTADLTPHPGNWRDHPAPQVEALKGVLKEVGIAGALLAYRSQRQGGALVVIDGHLRKDAAPQEWPVLVLDVDDAEADYLLSTIDPLSAMATADAGALDALLSSVNSGEAAVQAMLDELAESAGLYATNDDNDAEPQIDRAEELREQWGVEPGQMWRLPSRVEGQYHALICGDCTDVAVVGRVSIDGNINCGFTSPPYAEQRNTTYGGIPTNQYVEWWNTIQANLYKALTDDGSLFVNIKAHCENGQRELYVFDLVTAMVRQWGWVFIDELCWIRQTVPSDSDRRFKNYFEPIYHFSKGFGIKFRPHNVLVDFSPNTHFRGNPQVSKNTGHKWNATSELKGARASKALPSNVLDIPVGATAVHTGAYHPASFPVALPEFFIKAFSDSGDTWLDPFSGSGTTIIAAENLGRQARAVEISPAYCAVALQRYSDAFHITPELID